jgi:hypothetical protein
MTKKPPKANDAPLLEHAEKQNELDRIKDLLEAGKDLSLTHYILDIEVNWFTGSKKASGEIVEEFAEATGADSDTFSIPVTLFSSKHPFVSKCEEAKRALLKYRDLMTDPLAKIQALMTNEKPGVVISNQAQDKSAVGPSKKNTRHLLKDGGPRIIAAEKLDEFFEGLQGVYGPAVIKAVNNLNAHMDEVLKFERERRGNLFRAENYPKEVVVSIRPDVRRFGLGLDFDKQCPKAAAAIGKFIEQRAMDTVELAISDFIDGFMSYVKTVSKQLGYRVRVYPGAKHPVYGKYHEAEVIVKKTTEDDAEVAKDCFELQLRYLPEGSKKSQTAWLTVKKDEYQDVLKPRNTEERMKVVESTLEGLLWQLEKFTQMASTLGKAGAPLKGLVSQVRTMLTSAGNNNAEILKEMREGTFFRKQAAKELASVESNLMDILTALTPVKGRRRAVSVKDGAED